MKLIYKIGDLLQAEERFICHGCNAQGVMGSGVAKLIRDQEPAAYAMYRQAYDAAIQSGRKYLELGSVIWAIGARYIVLNAITQEYFGRDAGKGKVYVSYDAVRTAIRAISAETIRRRDENHALQIDEVAFPLIGAGLAGGDWHRIAAILEKESVFQPIIYTLDGRIP